MLKSTIIFLTGCIITGSIFYFRKTEPRIIKAEVVRTIYTNSPTTIVTNEAYFGNSSDLLFRTQLAAANERKFNLAAAIGFIQVIDMGNKTVMEATTDMLKELSQATVDELKKKPTPTTTNSVYGQRL
jgi:hypothetical protein